jgi:phosphoribosylformylglycinamidine synthase subunit PurQ / glutaminase
MKFAVLQFPASNCDQDAVHAIRALGHEAILVWHKEQDLANAEAVIVPGGFSYGDYLRCGAIARFSPVMATVREFALAGGLVLGICNGFQILCECGLLPGALVRNRSLQFCCETVHLQTVSHDSPFTCAIPAGQVLRMPVAHGEGCYFADEPTLAQLEANEQILWRYSVTRKGIDRGGQPQWFLAAHRRRLQSNPERGRADASPGTRLRTDPRECRRPPHLRKHDSDAPEPGIDPGRVTTLFRTEELPERGASLAPDAGFVLFISPAFQS